VEEILISGTQFHGITLLGLGPGGGDLLTRQAWQLLSSVNEVYLRTKNHPAVSQLPPGLAVHSFDALYDQAEQFEDVYQEIIAEILRLGESPGGVVYAVPGHPLIAEATGPEILRLAHEQEIQTRIVPGLSFLDSVSAALGLDLFPESTLVDAFDIARGHAPRFPPHLPALIAQLHSRQMASDVKLTLMNQYPDDHPVALVHGAGTSEEHVEDIPLHAVDRSERIGLLTSLYVPALSPDTGVESLQDIVATLRAPEGCPWDQEQTLESMRGPLMEEAFEVLEAIDRDDREALLEELGDLLFLVLFLVQMSTEEGDFYLSDVVEGITSKLIRRHPHVFGDVQLEDVDEVLVNWERLKADERENGGQSPKKLLDNVPLALPALAQSNAYQQRAARVGFDWPEIEGIYAKINEEIAEVAAAASTEAQSREIGDVLFAVVRLADRLGVDPETALRTCNQRFRSRFNYIEDQAQKRGDRLQDLTLDQLNELWEAAKNIEG
jgi:tetrapyrrole methylase family protein/MazG family protein